MSSSGVCKRVIFCALAGLGVFCLVFLFLNQWYGNPLKHWILSILAPQCLSEVSWNIKHEEEVDVGLSEEVDRLIDLQRKIIRDDMEDYQYPNGKYNRSARKLEDLLIEENGEPIRNIIVSTWRSGSSFLGGIINAHPGTFYHYEPLSDFDVAQIRGPPLAADAIKRAKPLFNCEYADLGKYLEYSITHDKAFNRNLHLMNRCKPQKNLCFNQKFLSKMCKVFPFQLMKLVRLRLNVAQELLADKKLAVRMVLLVRDPRGTIQSRKHHDWCDVSRDCSDPALLCADLASDYEIAVELLKIYPTTFKVIRYEDLAAEPYERVKEISEFYGLNFHEDIEVFLDTHTKRNDSNVFSTFRDSEKAPYHWKSDLSFEEVEEIQKSCMVAMKHWGYEPALNASHQIEFNPVTNYVLTKYSK